MAKRQREWATRRRAELMESLGNVCKLCPATTDLTLDCEDPQGPHHHRRLSSEGRISFYVRQHAAGNLRILCRTCNSRKATHDKRIHAARRLELEAETTGLFRGLRDAV